MSRKLLDLWTNFAISGTPHEKWLPIEGKSDEPGPAYTILDDKEIRSEYTHKFAEDMAFLATINALMKGYRDFEEEHHPAIKKLIADREQASFDDMRDEF